MRLEQPAYGVGDLAAAAVPDGDIDEHAALVLGGLVGLLEDAHRRVGQQVERADRVDTPALRRLSQVGDGVLDDAQQRAELLGRPAQVVARQQPERDDLDARILTPAEHVVDVVGAGPMAVAHVTGPGGPRPAPVAVEDDADVAGAGRTCERPRQSPLVDAVDQVAQPHTVLFPSPAGYPPHATNPCRQAATDRGTPDGSWRLSWPTRGP